MAALILMLLCTLVPSRALAQVVLHKDGLAQAEVADCIIDVESLQDCSFTASEGAPFVFLTDAGGYNELHNNRWHPHFGVYIDYEPKQGEQRIAGSFTLTFDQALLDSEGQRHDLKVEFSNVVAKWRYNTGTGRIQQHLLVISAGSMSLMAEPGALVRNNQPCYRPYFENNFNTLGISCDVTFWNADDASLRYNLFAEDLDQADRFTANTAAACLFGEAWAESYTPSSDFSSYHVSTDSWLATDGTRIYGTQSDNDQSLGRSAFVCTGTMAGAESPLAFTWKGSACATGILQDWAHRIKIKVIGGIGGNIATKAGNGTEIETNESDAWVEAGAVPKNDYTVSATPERGYHIVGMWLDGEPVSDAELQAGTVQLPYITADHEVAVQYEEDPPRQGSVSLEKSSAIPDITDDNPCYELSGAQYGVFSDEECTKTLGTLTTDEGGRSNALELDEGTYYVRETRAPAGFRLDDELHTVEVHDGEDEVLELTDPPLVATVGILALKVDQETGRASAQGGASLAGTEFSVAFYAGHYGAEELPEEAQRTWTIRTDASGHARLDEESLVGGDELYRRDGEIVVPLGTLVINETKAPQGYLLPDGQEARVMRVSADQQSAEVTGIIVPDEGNPTAADPVIRGGLRLKKTDESGDRALTGAVFAIENAGDAPVVIGGRSYPAGEVCLTVESGDDGIAQTGSRALPYGSYHITELKAPVGYAIDGSWSQDVLITEDGAVVDLTSQPARNKRLSAGVVITATKTFDGSSQGRSLEDGMFSFELLDEQGRVLQTKTNDGTGKIVFDTLGFDADDAGRSFSYTVREARGSDSDIVYDEHVEELVIDVRMEGEDALVAELSCDEDGISFHNSTVGPVEMPVTGQAGVRMAVPGVVMALAAGGTLIGRRRSMGSRWRRR